MRLVALICAILALGCSLCARPQVDRYSMVGIHGGAAVVFDSVTEDVELRTLPTLPEDKGFTEGSN